VTAQAVEPRFTLGEWSRIVSDPIRNMAYLSTQLGAAVADYLSWKQNEDGARATTIDSYERVLAQLAVTPPQPGLDTITIDHLRLVRDLRPPGSRHLVTAVYKDFFRWLYEEGRTDHNVAGRLRYPKRQRPPITDLFTDAEKSAIVAAQDSIRDRACVLLLLRAGIRKGELRHLRVKDLDLRERLILVRRGKGGKPRRVPVRGSLIQALDEFLLTEIPGLDRLPQPDDHLLYPGRRANQHAAGGEPNPKKPMAQSTTHRWWYRCLARWNMVAVQKNLGHSRIGTTIDTYTQFAFEDQEIAVDQLPEIEV
jgi:integrase